MQQLGIDKIIAVEGLLNQMQILNDFGFESIAIAENYNDKSIEKEVRNLFGSEDSGVVSLFNAPGVVQNKFRMSDILQITQSWTTENVYNIVIKLKQGSLKILYRITPHMVVIE